MVSLRRQNVPFSRIIEVIDCQHSCPARAALAGMRT
jgi:hypothetical protein